MSRYPIKKEFFPYSHFAPPINDPKTAGRLGALMKAPGWIWRDREISVKSQLIKSYDGQDIELLIMAPYGMDEPSPCLVYYHGGGFFFGATGYHYKQIKRCALDVCCKVVFVQYRLAPRNPHPTPSEDCYAALEWVFENARALNVDKQRVAVGGDSAGGALAAAVCQMARDRNRPLPCFQLLVYPVTDRRMNTDSCKRYTDTPMWNSKLSEKMWKGYVPDDDPSNVAYASPMEAESFENLPKAYVETAEFDCLHDEGVAYAEALHMAGVEVVLNETEGTMHGFDIVEKAPTVRQAYECRVGYMRKQFYPT